MKRFPLLIAASLLLAALLPTPTQAQPISLSSTWGQYDLQEQQGFSAGLLSLTGESSSGFTATVSSNGIAVGPDYPAYTGYPSKSQYLPRLYTIFAGQPITNNGQRVTFSFDVKFNDLADSTNVGSFRFSMGDTNCNNAWGEFLGMGTTSGSTFRYDSTMTQDTNWVDSGTGFYLFMPPDLTNPNNPTNYSFGSFGDFNGSSVGGGSAPNGVGMGVDTTTVQHIRFSVERTPSGLQVDSVWSNSAGPAINHAAFAPVPGGTGDDHNGGISPVGTSPWTNVNVFGFCLFGTGANEHFFGYNPGSFTVSNLKAYYGFNITGFERDNSTGDNIITWESTAVDVCEYVVQTSTDFNTWTSISTNTTGGFTTSYTNTASSDSALFYRVQKVYP
ncbi:MAG: hypothetical protein HY298_22440 [Verrucomicrobia bacterium]|nr:hypothetical protein [Verrucomicrobiota bacterium]